MKKSTLFSISVSILFVAMAGVQYYEIGKKRAIHGFEGERRASSRKITRKKEESYRGKGKTTTLYYLCYQNAGEKCVNVDQANYIVKQVGDEISVVRIPGDEENYHPSGVYADGIGFDRFLLYCEIFGAFIFLLKSIFPQFLRFDRFNKAENISLFEK